MTNKATVKIPGNANFCGGEIQNAKFQNLATAPENAGEAQFWYDSVNHKPMYNNGTTNKEFGKEYSAGAGIVFNGTTIQTDTTIASKTDIGDGALTIQRNGTAIGTFKANATSGTTVNITVPTQASDINALPSSTVIGNGPTIFKKNGTAFATITANQTSTINVDYTIPTAVTDLSDAGNYALKSEVASAIIPKGSIAAVSGLPTLVAEHRGWMYNFSAEFTTTADFVEGASKKYPAGTNVVVVEYTTGTYKYDIFAGFVDTTSYDNHLANATVHITASERSTWNGKQNALTPGSNIQISDNTISATDTTYSAFVGSGSSAAEGLVPKPSTTAGTSNFLCENGTWAIPVDTTYTFSTGLINTSGTVTADIATSIRPTSTAVDTTMPSELAVSKELAVRPKTYLCNVKPVQEEDENAIYVDVVSGGIFSEVNGNRLIVNFSSKIFTKTTLYLKVNSGTQRQIYVDGSGSIPPALIKGTVEFVFYNNIYYATTVNKDTNTTYTFSTGLTNTSGTVTVTDYDKLAKKFTTTIPATTASGGVASWTITNSLTTADVDVSIYEVGSTSNTKVYPAVEVNASNIIVSLLSSSNISAGTYKAVITG